MGSVKPYLLCCFVLWAHSALGQEICDNGQDDDGDRLVDLNDPECQCKGIKDTFFIPSSLIPNPSFEDYVCCPDNLAQMHCARGWIQASNGTSDYFNTCGFSEDVQRGRPPRPLPAGNGYVGFLDIQNFPGIQGGYKEYIGACLNSTMQPNKEYSLSFWVGFGSRGSMWGPRSSTTLSIFGTSRCANLPFGDLNRTDNYRCPTAYNTGSRVWYELTRFTVAGLNTWVKVNLKIKPSLGIEAIAIGPECRVTDGGYFFWLDELILEETAKFDSLTFSVEGNPCRDTVVLRAPKTVISKITFQWYRDGVAIAGATSPDYVIPKGQEGRYLLRASDGVNCELSKPYDYKIHRKRTDLSVQICDGASYAVGQQRFDKEGQYEIALRDANGCDSVIFLDLKVLKPAFSKLDTTICSGQELLVNNMRYRETGIYRQNFTTKMGCDSQLVIDLKVIDHVYDTVYLKLCNGDFYLIDTTRLYQSGIYQFNYTTNANCDSTLVVALTTYDHSQSKLDTAICDGDRLRINGVDYIRSGTYNITLKNTFGCDSNLLLTLKVNPISDIHLDTSACSGRSMRIGNRVLDQSGNYHIQLKSSYGCDSNVHVRYTQHASYQKLIDTTICDGSWFQFGNQRLTNEGHYSFNYTTYTGCDSNYVVRLRTARVDSSVVDTVLCEGKSMTFNGMSIDMPGVYRANLKNVHLCDSNVSLVLSLAPNYRIDLKQSICEGEKYQVGDRHLHQSGFYTIPLATQFGCDSIVTLDLQVYPKHQTHIDTTICPDQAIRIGSNIYDSSGVFILKNISQLGCDSTVYIKISKRSRPIITARLENPKCAGDATGVISIMVQQPGGGPYHYSWSNGQVGPRLDNLKAGRYRLTLVDQFTCSIAQDFEMSEPPSLQMEVAARDASCASADSGYLEILSLAGGTPPYRLTANGTPLKIQNHFKLLVGDYRLDLVDSNNCSLTKNVRIQSPELGSLEVSPSNADLVLGDTLYLSASLYKIHGIKYMRWTGNGDIACDTCLVTYVVAKKEKGHFELRVVDDKDCVYVGKVTFRAHRGFYVPNVFSPNGDGLNDFFHLYSDRSVEKIDWMQIYDRWGELIYQMTDLFPNQDERAWDGTFRGRAMPPGVYLYFIKFRDKSGVQHTLTGDVTLIR